MIGNTPMIKIRYIKDGMEHDVYIKVEYYNLTGSIKDRMANYILMKAKEKGVLKDGMPIIEATSGNTGISFAALGARYGHPVTIFMPDWCSSERKKLMKSYGADVILVSKEEGGFTECIKRADECAIEKNGFRPNQFSNLDNPKAHYLKTAHEIIETVPDVTGFVSGIGTGGTLIGIGSLLKEKNQNINVVAFEPVNMPILSGGKVIGPHKIEGIGDDFIPEIVDRSMIDDVYLIDDQDAVNMARLLARKLGLGVGISSGANFLAAVMLEEVKPGKVVTVFPDDNKKYLSTSYCNDIEENDIFLSNQITLLDYEIIS